MDEINYYMVYHQLKITNTADVFAIWCLLVIYRQSDVVPLRALNCAVTLSPVHVGIRAPGYWKPVWNPHKLDLVKECFPELGGLNLFYYFFSNGWSSCSVSLTYLVQCTGESRTDAPCCCSSKVSYNTDEYTYSRGLTLYWIHCFNQKV